MTQTQSLERHPILDFHAHLIPGREAVNRLLAVMDRYGILRAVVSASGMIDPDQLSRQAVEGGEWDVDADNDSALDGVAAGDSRLIPFFFANPHQRTEAYGSRAAEFRGLELSPAVHGIALTDPRNIGLVEIAERHGHPVYVVCLGRAGVAASDLVELARRFPAVTFVLGHCGFTAIDLYALNTVASQHNVVAETSGCYSFVVRAAIERLGADRVLFGTEYPLQHPSVEFAKFATLELVPQVWQQVAWDNALRILGEDAA